MSARGGVALVRRALLALAGVAGLVAGASCGSASKAEAYGARPADFTLAATVFSPVTDAAQAEALARPLRPARYIIEADGVLRAAVGPGASTETYPPQTRRLNEAQLDGLWRLVTDGGVLEEGSVARVGNPDTYVPPRGRTVALIAVSHGGRRETVAAPLDRAGADAAAAARLVDRLAALAWLRE